jgi:hypothetical protein
LQTYETALNYISTTKTRSGLKVTATLSENTYETGKDVTNEEMELLKIRRHRTLPEWTYTIKPQTRNRPG